MINHAKVLDRKLAIERSKLDGFKTSSACYLSKYMSEKIRINKFDYGKEKVS